MISASYHLLFLYQNSLTRIPQSLFSHLTNLVFLFVSLSPTLSSHLVCNYPFLTILFLFFLIQSSSISLNFNNYYPLYLFFLALSSLHLYSNSFHSLSSGAFHGLKSLSVLFIIISSLSNSSPLLWTPTVFPFSLPSYLMTSHLWLFSSFHFFSSFPPLFYLHLFFISQW